jgi:hypothetical protein
MERLSPIIKNGLAYKKMTPEGDKKRNDVFNGGKMELLI